MGGIWSALKSPRNRGIQEKRSKLGAKSTSDNGFYQTLDALQPTVSIARIKVAYERRIELRNIRELGVNYATIRLIQA